eukprot:GHVQ01023994.1.p1 GENE.GHVQ01023994.1~~GHVQ01023994.1.p1  ORF type:complete len:116 (-),score=13.35 GHVQ01023994.1:1452-1799(-)
MNRVSADSNHTGSRTSDGSTLSETTGFDSKVEQSISRVHSSVDELTAELYLLKLSLSDVARSGGQPEKFCTPEGKAFPAHLEKVRRLCMWAGGASGVSFLLWLLNSRAFWYWLIL